MFFKLLFFYQLYEFISDWLYFFYEFSNRIAITPKCNTFPDKLNCQQYLFFVSLSISKLINRSYFAAFQSDPNISNRRLLRVGLLLVRWFIPYASIRWLFQPTNSNFRSVDFFQVFFLEKTNQNTTTLQLKRKLVNNSKKIRKKAWEFGLSTVSDFFIWSTVTCETSVKKCL